MGPFTSVFGMGTGVASPLWPPEKTGPGLAREIKTSAQSGNGIASSLDGGGTGRPDLQMKFSSKNGQAARLISSGPLSPLLDLHARPIEVVVYDRPSDPFGWENLSLGRLGA